MNLFQTSLELYEEEKDTNPNHVATPRWVVEGIYEKVYIEKFDNIWFPFNNYDSEFKLKADELELKYKATHKFDDLGNDFFFTNPPENCQLMISNPPFDLQNEVIKRSFYFIETKQILSFALLLPLATLETRKRAYIYEKYSDRLSIGVFSDRIRFIGHEKSFNKPCCWICYNIPALKDKPLWWIY